MRRLPLWIALEFSSVADARSSSPRSYFFAHAIALPRTGLPHLPRRRQHDRQQRDTALSPSTAKSSATAFTAACNALIDGLRLLRGQRTLALG